VAASEKVLERLTGEIKEASLDLERTRNDVKRATLQLNSSTASIEKHSQARQAAIIEAENRLNKLDSDEKAIEKQIKERTAYLNSQEKIIAETVNEGNEKLLDLNDGILRLESLMKQLKAQHVTLKQEYDAAVVEFEAQKDYYAKEIENLQGQKQQLLKESDNLTERISKRSAEYKRISDEVDKKLAYIKEKEESLIAKRDALILDKQKLQQEKSRWDSTKVAYDI
jgi:chromosome segregation ATPase